MAYLVKARVGRSQGAVIFWGLVSAFFASAFCYYYLENRNNEEKNRQLVDQDMILQGERDSLTSEREKLEAAASDNEKQMTERQQFLQEKEDSLAAEESQMESATPSSAALQAAQAAGVKKFNEAVLKLAAQVPDAEVITRGGRPVLRVPASYFFDPAAVQLKPDGKALLNGVVQGATGTTSRFELRVENFTDSSGESPAAASGAPAQPVDAWTLTAERAGNIAHYLRDAGGMPFQNVVAVGRADFLPVAPNAKPDHSPNRRVEITITPIPQAFHAPETPKTAHGKTGGAAASATSPSDTSASTGSP